VSHDPSASCKGFDEMWGLCPDLPSCEDCTPVDCQFGEWGEWYDSFGHCTGLRFRERTIAVRNNECGQPCSGAQIESTEHVAEDCLLERKHCKLSEWSGWSECAAETGQVYRKRTVLNKPENGGEPCTGSMEETRPCGENHDPLPCQFSEWQEWTTCSTSCGEGRHTRMRRIVSEAKNGGEACEDVTLETKACSAVACEGRDCTMGAWSEWSMCDTELQPQRFRNRQVQQGALGGGLRCNQTLKETQGCPSPKDEPCLISEWSEWAALGWREANPPMCNKECGGGQSFRTRTMQAPPQHGGSCPSSSLRELKACNTGPCTVDCVLDEWSEWSVCSVDCGQGRKTRSRKIKNPDEMHSQGCVGGTEEVIPCQGSKGLCPHTDCLWSQWNDWSSCTASCGGGMMHRNRAIQALPENGGAACEALTKGEASACNLQPCGEECVDGAWSAWEEWTPCTATCGGAYAVRERNINLYPNKCGRPAAGVKHEYKTCDLPTCEEHADRDCGLSAWSEWSACSCTCFGVRERQRYIETVATGNGKRCDMETLKEMSPCSPGLTESPPAACSAAGPRDCELSLWGDWSACSQRCGGGQREKSRKVLTFPTNGGKTCDGELTLTGPCNLESCQLEECIDCEWGEWSAWGDCSGCQGERYRHRSILKMPNHCGRMCDLRSAKEVSNCSTGCEASLYCAWTEWTTASGCGVGCGYGTAMRSRALSLTSSPESALFSVEAGARCQGAQLNLSTCEATTPCTPPCIPIDCKFNEWSAWGPPTNAGLCERNRGIALQSNDCGQPCSGSMSETKACVQPNADRRDCAVSDWTAWSDCALNGKVGQRYRERAIMQEPTFDGNPCEGTLHETLQCSPIEPKHCMLSAWGDWATCGASCGGGFQGRQRSIIVHSEHNGAPCQDSLDEMRMCNTQACMTDMRDCAYGGWSAWSGCGADSQRYRQRQITTYAIGAGAPCDGELEQTAACEDTEKVDCVVSEWTMWDSCDKTCGGGQMRRQRQIMVFPSKSGEVCPGELIQTTGCNAVPCSAQDCQVSDWQEWSQCSASCGVAQRMRNRAVLQNRGPDGIGCNLNTSEVAHCPMMPACPRDDCQWGEWEEWEKCSCECDGGQQTRVRHISKMPQNGGKMCEVQDKAEVRACNTQACSAPACEDGLWAEWAAWTSCSATCGGGTTFRSRQIARMANHCGQPVTGDTRETAVCNQNACEPDVDCMFSDWGLWSDCSQTCHGIMRRARRIDRYGSGNGGFCEGHLKEVASCNPAPGEGAGPCEMEEKPAVNCALSEWSAWAECSATCGGGEHTRSRYVAVPAAHGGTQCQDTLTEARQCGTAVCQGPAPVDCEFGEWGDWGECAKCDGERARFRHILQHPRNGGKPCEKVFDAEEAEACPRRCYNEQYCSWGEWTNWGDCTAKCGQGKRARRRYLGLTSEPAALPPPVTELMGAYTDLRKQAQHLDEGRVQELSLAFAAGLLSFIALLATGRAAIACGARRRSAARHAVAGVRSEELAATELPLVGMA